MRILATIMAITIQFSLSPESRAVLAQWKDADARVATALTRGVDRILVDAENHLKVAYLSGPSGGGKGGATPVGLRSGALRQAVTHERTDATGGYVGTSEGPTSRYAGVILGDATWTIKPRSAKHLWIPIADNLNPSGIARFTPRAAMDLKDARGKRLLRIFTSKAGHLVAFLPEFKATGQDDHGNAIIGATGARIKRGQNKGREKGKLLFVLKDEVTIKGTDALVKAISDRLPQAQVILSEELQNAFNG